MQQAAQNSCITRLRVGVFMGGSSVEREVSFNSGRTVCDHLDEQLYETIPIFLTAAGELFIIPWFFVHRGKISDFEDRLAVQAEKITWDDIAKRVDFMYIATHGRGIEDGVLVGALDVLGVPYFGSGVLASALAMDKVRHNALLASAGIDIPKNVVISAGELCAHISELNHNDGHEQLGQELTQRCARAGLSLPVIVKPAREGSSIGISVVRDAQELLQASIHAMTCSGYDYQDVLVEEYLEGMEFCTVFLEHVSRDQQGRLHCQWQPLSITEVVREEQSDIFDYTQKYMPGRAQRITPARCTPELTQRMYATCEQVIACMGFRSIIRIDGFVTADNRVVIIDSNPISGMGPSFFLFHQAAEVGLSHAHLITHLITNELTRRNMTQALTNLQNTMLEHGSDKKLRVAVLLGGDSAEREISLESGRNVCYKLDPACYTIIPVFVRDDMKLYTLSPRLLVQNSTHEIVEQVSQSLDTDASELAWSDLKTLCDFVFIALHGGRGENGSVQSMLELLGLPYNGSGIAASALCMDKFKTNELLRAGGIAVPDSYLLTRELWETCVSDEFECALICQKIIEQVGLPLIAKPHDDGCSTHVVKVAREHELRDIITYYFTHTNKAALLCEEFVQGTELTVGVLGNERVQVLPASQPIVQGEVLSLEDKFLPGFGENRTPADLPASAYSCVAEVIARAYTVAGCRGYARIDCFYQTAAQSKTGSERAVVLEINSLPALTPATCLFHQAAEVGIRPREFLHRIVQLGLEYHIKQTISHRISATNSPLARTVLGQIRESASKQFVE